MFFSLDPMYWVFVGPALLLAFGAQMLVKGSFGKWSRVANGSGLTGAEAAALMLRHAGIEGVEIRPVSGYLTDHYDPRSRSLGLSPEVYGGRSVAALGVACHEAGHAIQHARRDPFLWFRSKVVPLASFGSWISWPLIFGGFLLGSMKLALVGVIAFGALVLFQLLTLPVEFDASRRAKKHLHEMGIYRGADEARGVASVLGAAALTYVAATAQAIAQLLYFLYILGFLGGRSRQ